MLSTLVQLYSMQVLVSITPFYLLFLPFEILEITVTSNLSPSVHINDIVSRAHKRALAIHRCFASRDVSVLLRAYKVYVRSLVEHNSVIWSPNTLCDIDAVECAAAVYQKTQRPSRPFI